MVNVFIDARMSVSPKGRSPLSTFWRKDLCRKAMGPFHWLLLENMHQKDRYEYRAGPQDRFLTNVIHLFRHIGYCIQLICSSQSHRRWLQPFHRVVHQSAPNSPSSAQQPRAPGPRNSKVTGKPKDEETYLLLRGWCEQVRKSRVGCVKHCSF